MDASNCCLLLQQILDPNNEVRTKAEKIFENYSDTQPDQLFFNLITIISEEKIDDNVFFTPSIVVLFN